MYPVSVVNSDDHSLVYGLSFVLIALVQKQFTQCVGDGRLLIQAAAKCWDQTSEVSSGFEVLKS